jgi:serine phosphatase RsbU (regulator of sigma subunit)
MGRLHSGSIVQKWGEIIYEPDRAFVQDMNENQEKYRNLFIGKISEYLYADMRSSEKISTAPFSFDKIFGRLSGKEKILWYDYVSLIPDKLLLLNLRIRPFKEYCATCIITDKEIEKLACFDHKSLSAPGKRFYKEMNYHIPLQLKKIGYEIIRPGEVEEIDYKMIRKLARAVHSRYLQNMKNPSPGSDPEQYILSQYPDDSGEMYLTEFDNLPDEIICSNMDNAYHIPTKLLSIGYKLRPLKKGYKPVTLHLDDNEIETMAKVEHIRWSWDKRLNGWKYGSANDNVNKIHRRLVPYDLLPESEKDKDRALVRLIPALLRDIDYEAYPVNPNRLSKLSYAIKPQSSIHRLLLKTRELNDQIRKLVTLSPEVDMMMNMRNKNIEEVIRDVEGSYNCAQHIQETFLPDDLYIRECFTHNFVIYKPKDIVSGDFYFFSKCDDKIIFAAADCTGHGIAGALLSTLCYGILDQAVNELKLTDPSIILSHLYLKVHKFLRNQEEDTGVSDELDITLCVLDRKSNILSFSGKGCPLFRISNGNLLEYKSSHSIAECGNDNSDSFITESIQLKNSDTIYLFSDGYADQFGGIYRKRYSRKRFKEFLVSIHKNSMSEQSDLLYGEIEKWMEESDEEQIDDILVIGVRI